MIEGVRVIVGLEVGRGVFVIVGLWVIVGVMDAVWVALLVFVIVAVFVGSGARMYGYERIIKTNPAMIIESTTKTANKYCLRFISVELSCMTTNHQAKFVRIKF